MVGGRGRLPAPTRRAGAQEHQQRRPEGKHAGLPHWVTSLTRRASPGRAATTCPPTIGWLRAKTLTRHAERPRLMPPSGSAATRPNRLSPRYDRDKPGEVRPPLQQHEQAERGEGQRGNQEHSAEQLAVVLVRVAEDDEAAQTPEAERGSERGRRDDLDGRRPDARSRGPAGRWGSRRRNRIWRSFMPMPGPPRRDRGPRRRRPGRR
jgi:hypothetical protein